jgi:hypothetical protein
VLDAAAEDARTFWKSFASASSNFACSSGGTGCPWATMSRTFTASPAAAFICAPGLRGWEAITSV